MRGDDDQQDGMFSYISPEKRVPADHPLRPIRKMVDEILKEMSPKFAKLYSNVGRPSIAPERLLRSLLLQVFYSVRRWFGRIQRVRLSSSPLGLPSLFQLCACTSSSKSRTAAILSEPPKASCILCRSCKPS